MSVTYDIYYTFIHTLYSLTLIANGISRLLKINGSITPKKKIMANTYSSAGNPTTIPCKYFEQGRKYVIISRYVCSRISMIFYYFLLLRNAFSDFQEKIGMCAYAYP
jgi:hypothetical protein